MEFYFQNALAPSTRRSYSSAKKRYLQFCLHFNFQPVPVSEQHICQYVSKLSEEGVSHASIKCYLSAVRHLQIAQGFADPHMSDMPKLEQVVKRVKSFQARNRPKHRVRLPITPDILLKIRGEWENDSSNPDHVMLWAATCTCFFGFLRAGELTVPADKAYDPGEHLNFADISIDNPQSPTVMRVRIKASKTDPFRRGVDIFMGRTHTKLCPIEAMLAYLAVRGSKEGFLFTYKDGRLLSKERFVSGVREALRKAGINQKQYAGHSFRIGAATTASQRGISESTIKMLGRWESSAYQLYVRTPRENLASISAVLGRQS